MNRAVILLLGGLLGGLPTPGPAALRPDAVALGHPRWLVGTWALCEDPDGDPRDTLRFEADGNGVGADTRGLPRFSFRYVVHGIQVAALARRPNGQTVPLVFDIAPARDRLRVANFGPTHASVYVRQGTETRFHCSVK